MTITEIYNREIIKELLIKQHEILGNKVREEVENFWMIMKVENNKQKSWEEKSVLQLSCAFDNYTLKADWRYVEWIGKKGNRKPIKKTIGKSRNSTSYSILKLLFYARSWEIEYVKDMERKLTWYRKEFKYLNRIIRNINWIVNFQTYSEICEGMDVKEEPEVEENNG